MKKRLIYVGIGIIAILSIVLLLNTNKPGKFVNFLNTQLNEDMYKNLNILETQRETYKKASEEFATLYSSLEKERDTLLMQKGSLLDKSEFLDENLLAYEHMLDYVKTPEDNDEILKILFELNYSASSINCSN